MDYDFGNKRHYRRNVYSFVNSYCKKSIKDRKIFCIDTKEGLEVRFLLDHGYRPENIYVSNSNPAEVAWLTRNLKNDLNIKVNTYGVEAGYAASLIHNNGISIDVWNLDLMCTLSSNRLHYDLMFVGEHLVTQEHIVCVNILRGREGADYFNKRGVKELPITKDEIRYRLIEGSITRHSAWGRLDCLCHILHQRHEIYRSNAGHQTMMWFAFHVEKHKQETLRNYIIKADYPPVYQIPLCMQNEVEEYVSKGLIRPHVDDNLMAKVNENYIN